MMTILDEIRLGTHAPTALYHYTNVGAFLPMVQHQKIWASCVYYMNDRVEILHGAKLLRDCVRETPIELDDADVIRSTLEDWLNTFDLPHNIFVFSLSEARDDLSQWRAYTEPSKGLCIGFSEETIKVWKELGLLLARVIYNETEQRDRVKRLLSDILFDLSHQIFMPKVPKEELGGWLFQYFNRSWRARCVQVLATMKDASFSQEMEWRLISPQIQLSDPGIKYREGASMLVPYIEIGVPRFIDEGHEVLLHEILVGPSNEEGLVIAALQNLSYGNVTRRINATTIPYRHFPKK
jgi:hypothetical protein